MKYIISLMIFAIVLLSSIPANTTAITANRNRYLYIKANPNPASSKLSIQLYGLYSIRVLEKCYIADILGRSVLDLTEDARRHSDGTKSFFDLSVTNLIPGVYLIVLQGDKSVKTKHLSIVR